ncbi:hypothetical protein [Gilvibacter sediminis]|nr:hypothetical protein [Gilvibacter sediminis]MDC7997404.1 hypothetical protein [Gilvibacter sediminis]
MKNLLNLNGAQALSNEQLKAVNGGFAECRTGCPFKLGRPCDWCVD